MVESIDYDEKPRAVFHFTRGKGVDTEGKLYGVLNNVRPEPIVLHRIDESTNAPLLPITGNPSQVPHTVPDNRGPELGLLAKLKRRRKLGNKDS